MASLRKPVIHDKDILIVEDICNTCLEDENVDLKTCSRCHLMKYCSVQCQREDFPGHKKNCRNIKRLTDRVERLAEELRCVSLYGRPDANYFEEGVGRFWGLWDTRDYCRARLQLADEIYTIGYYLDSKRIYDVALSHYLELLRLIHGDNLGLRYRVPFFLLTLNRDEDAYNFIKWWETIDPDGHYDWGNPPPSQEGEWLYLKDQDIHEDLLKIVKTVDGIPFLAALVLIKARIILTYEIAESQFQTFQEVLQAGSSRSQSLQRSVPAMAKIKRFLCCNNAMLRAQKQQLEEYLNVIQRLNPYFLKAVVNPGLIMNMEPPEYIQRGTISEVYEVLNDCKRLFVRSKVAMAAIIKRVGKNPTF